MPKIAILYHSGYGHTERQARAVEQGARSHPGAEVALIPVADWEQHRATLDAADAFILGCPTYMGSMSAPMKAFLDGTGGIWHAQSWKDKLAAGFTNSGSPAGDKFNTLVGLATFAAQHGMLWVSLGLLPRYRDEQGREINRSGSFLGATAQSPGVDRANEPPEDDLETARILGRRVARAAERWSERR
jgi:NAD(P)H dehydrogenase (quinone)